MGQIADDMINGRCCSECNIYFIEEHGYPVLCVDCYINDDLPLNELPEFPMATIEEM